MPPVTEWKLKMKMHENLHCGNVYVNKSYKNKVNVNMSYGKNYKDKYKYHQLLVTSWKLTVLMFTATKPLKT